ncbi:hypothetical protein D9M68_339160 [compost metagenome]
MVEQVPAQAGAADQVQGVRCAVQRAGGPDDAAQEAQGRVEVGFGHADQRRLGGHLELRGADVRPAQEQVGRYVLQHRAVDQRDQPLLLTQLRQRPWRPADQRGQGIAADQDLALQLGDGAQGAQVLGPGLLHVEFGFLAALEQPFGDIEAAFLQLRVVAGDAQARLEGAQQVVGIGHLGAQQHQQVFAIGQGGEVGGIGRLDGAAEAPPEVQFPGDVEADAVLPELAVLGVEPAGLVALEVDAVGAGLLELRVAAAQGDAQLGAGLQHPQAGDLQVGIVAVRLADQLLQRRVFEHLPPLLVVRLRTEEAGLLQGGAVPVFDPGFLRGLEVRPEAHAAAEAEYAEDEQPARGEATPRHGLGSCVRSAAVRRAARLPGGFPPTARTAGSRPPGPPGR